MNKLHEIQIDIVNSLTNIEDKTKTDCDLIVKRLNSRIKCELKLMRDAYACQNLITALLIDNNKNKMCLAYLFKGKLYSTAKKVKDMENTEYLHSLNLNMSEWDNMAKFSVWIGTGKIYDTVEV